MSAGPEDDDRKRDREPEDRHEGDCRQPNGWPTAQRPRPDAHHRLQHDCEDRCLQPEEDALDQPDVTVSHVDKAEGEDREKTRQDEEDAGDDPAPGAVQQPAEVDRQLLRLGAGKQHAEVQRVQEA